MPTKLGERLATIFCHNEIIGTEEIDVFSFDNKIAHHLKNTNKLLSRIDGIIGGKTGYTNAAGKTYVGKFQRGSQVIIVSLLGSSSMWTDVATLVEHGFARQEMASRLPDEGAEGVRVSQVNQENMAKEHLKFAMLTGEQKKANL